MSVHVAADLHLFAQKCDDETPPRAADVSREEFDEVKRLQAEQADRLAIVELTLKALTARLAVGSE